MPGINLLVVASLILMLYAVFQLGVIGASDFKTQKIRNRDIGFLLMTGIGIRILDWVQHSDRFGLDLTGRYNFIGSVVLSVALFVVLFVFWLLKKVGAGDVKLLGVVPLVVGFQHSLVFAIMLMVCTLLMVLAMKQPMLLPDRLFREYVASLARFDRVPFGVPISAAAIITLAITMVTLFTM